MKKTLITALVVPVAEFLPGKFLEPHGMSIKDVSLAEVGIASCL